MSYPHPKIFRMINPPYFQHNNPNKSELGAPKTTKPSNTASMSNAQKPLFLILLTTLYQSSLVQPNPANVVKTTNYAQKATLTLL